MLEDIVIRLEDNFSEYLTDIRENEDKRIANELIRIENERARNEYFAKLIAETKSYLKRIKKVYGTVSENEKRFALPDEYTPQCLLDVFVNGFCLNKNEYAVEGHDVVLTKPLDVIGTAVELVVTRTVTITADDYDNLRGLRGFSAYELAVQNGFQGTEDEWLRSLNGSGGYDRIVNYYTTKSENESRFKLPYIYTPQCLLDVFVNGFKLNKNEYSVEQVGTEYFLILTTALDVVGTALEIDVINAFPATFEESDPTVLPHVKNITEEDIENWNNKSEFNGNYEDLENKPQNLVQDENYIHTDNNFTTEEKEKLDKLESFTEQEINTLFSSFDNENQEGEAI